MATLNRLASSAFRSTLSFGLFTALASASCAGDREARQPCPAQVWEGTCKLRDLRKVEERALPIPYVVYEATYTPETNPRFPQFTPAEVRLRFGTPGPYEYALVDHLKPQTEVECHAPSMPGSCQPNEVVARVIPFDPERATTTLAPQATGCAAIDAASEQDRLTRSRADALRISQRFDFAASSAAPSPDAAHTARELAELMTDDPSLECVGLVGQVDSDESTALGEARARAIKQLLSALGVDPKRLLTMAATADVYGPGVKEQASDPTRRRVSVSVLIKTKTASQP